PAQARVSSATVPRRRDPNMLVSFRQREMLRKLHRPLYGERKRKPTTRAWPRRRSTQYVEHMSTSGKRILGLFAKHPRPGHVKTRLAAETSPEWAAEVAAAVLQDLLDRFAALDVTRVLAYTPADAEAYFVEEVRGRFA